MADIHAKLLEEKLLRATRAKRRFKAAVRHVIYNLPWLVTDDTFETDNVKRTVGILTRKKKQTEGLSIREKAVLRKAVQYRTEEEKRILNKFIGGLKCFRGYPENIQMELVGVTYFEYYPRGRCLIRQNDEGHALYFILTGEVIITKLQKDEITNKDVDVELARIKAGNMFGEISLLHNIPRTATVTTAEPCELLVLRKDDFDRVLKASLMQRWDEIRDAMLKFVYFDQWDSVAIRECCMLADMKSYATDDVIFGDRNPKKGAVEKIYFVVQGRCAIVEHLFVEETLRLGKTYYSRYEPVEPEVLEELGLPPIIDEEDHSNISKKSTVTEMSRRSKLSSYISCDERITKSMQTAFSQTDQEKLKNMRRGTKSTSRALSVLTTKDSVDIRSRSSISIKKVIKNNELTIMAYRTLLQKELNRYSLDQSALRKSLPSNVKICFMQICTMGEKATFFGGDLMKNRRIIALTPVTILRIPSYWLLKHNKGRVWTRVERFFSDSIPSREEVFKMYVANKKWQEYKRKLRDSILANRKFFNNTTIHDVPYSIRIRSNYE